MPIGYNELVRIIDAVLENLGASDRKVITELAMAAWLKTLTPEQRYPALDEWGKRVRWRLDFGDPQIRPED